MLRGKFHFKSGIDFQTTIKISGVQSLERHLELIMMNKESIDSSAPLVYSEMKDGVLPETDIRTDRFEIAQAAMDKVAASVVAKRDERIKNGSSAVEIDTFNVDSSNSEGV